MSSGPVWFFFFFSHFKTVLIIIFHLIFESKISFVPWKRKRGLGHFLHAGPSTSVYMIRSGLPLYRSNKIRLKFVSNVFVTSPLILAHLVNVRND